MRNFLLSAGNGQAGSALEPLPRWGSIAEALRLAATAADDPSERLDLEQWAAVASAMAISERQAVITDQSAGPTATADAAALADSH